jgi:thiol-disulfide isomerase/thioredoxin
MPFFSGGPVAADEASQRPPFPDGVVFSSFDGKTTMEISEFRGRPVLITFWASWCGPCRVELPELSGLYGELMGRGFVLITVNLDQNPVAGRRFLDALGLKLPVYRIDPRATTFLGIDSLPTNILLDQEGRLVQAYKGYTPEVVEDVRRRVLELTESDQP